MRKLKKRRYHPTAYKYRVVEGDALDGDYPNEQFVNVPPTTKDTAQKVADLFNTTFSLYPGMRRYWRVVNVDYKLQGGFEP